MINWFICVLVNQVESMKQIARKKANEERKRLESEVIWNKFHAYCVVWAICSLDCSGLSFITILVWISLAATFKLCLHILLIFLLFCYEFRNPLILFYGCFHNIFDSEYTNLLYKIWYFQLELALMVEKLQELRSIRVQKMKKQGEIFLFTYFFFFLEKSRRAASHYIKKKEFTYFFIYLVCLYMQYFPTF